MTSHTPFDVFSNTLRTETMAITNRKKRYMFGMSRNLRNQMNYEFT